MKIKTKNSIIKLLKIFLLLALASFILLESLIIANESLENYEKTDIVIILGARIKGEMLSLALEERLKTGLNYLKSNPESLVIVSGGRGGGEDITEAEAMKRYLFSHGISNERILLEDKSSSTMENFKFSKPIITAALGYDVKKITIVTNGFHMFRSMLLAKRNGFEPFGVSAKTPSQVVIQSHLREYLALIKSFCIDRLT